MNELNPKDQPRDQIAQEVIGVIVDAVHLHHLDKSEIKLDMPLTQDGLNLDSIDVLEIVVAVEHHFGVKVADAEIGKKYFRSVGTIADFIQIQRGLS